MRAAVTNWKYILTFMVSAMLASIGQSALGMLVYKTDKLAKIGTEIGLPEVGLDTMKVTYNNKPVVVNVNQQGHVRHIGYRIFNDDQRLRIILPALEFIERYSLEADLKTPRENTVGKQMLEDEVTLTGSTLTSLPKDVTGDSIKLNVRNIANRSFTVTWTLPTGKVVTMAFPLNYDLLSGCDIEESERRLPGEIMAFKPDTTAIAPPTDLTLDEKNLVLSTPVDSYLVDSLTSVRYYEDFEGEIEPLYDLDFPAYTMANLLTGTDIASNFSIEVKLRCYNYHYEYLTVPINQFVGYFLSQGCKPYFGVRGKTDGLIVGELLYVNKEMGYCHVLKVTLSEKDLIDRKGTIQARMVSYVPVSRISNIFDDFK